MSMLFTPYILSSDSPSPFIPSYSKNPTLLSNLSNSPFSVTYTPGSVLAPTNAFLSPVLSMSLPSYLDVNSKPETKYKVSDFFYYLVIDKWLWSEDLNDILNYLQVAGDKVDIIKSLKDYSRTNINKDTQKTTESKVKFIETKILSKDRMLKILSEFAKDTGLTWEDMTKNHYFIRDLVKKYLKRKLQNMIEKK